MAYNIGISLAVGVRGRGIGWRAQRMLAEHLFATTEVFRVEAGTDVHNVAEQRSLEKAGFTREGVAARRPGTVPTAATTTSSSTPYSALTSPANRRAAYPARTYPEHSHPGLPSSGSVYPAIA